MRIVEERENYAIVEDRERWCVLERRAGKYYPLRDGARDGQSAENLARLKGVEWLDEARARARLVEVNSRRRDLAERLW
jgi:hypothetical protein